MKKILTILGTIGLTATSTISLISCGKPHNNEKGEGNNKPKPKEKITQEETSPSNINLPNQDEILKYKKIQESFLSKKHKFLGDLSISPPNKIIVKNPRKVSYEELERNLDKTLTEAAKKINKSFTKNDVNIEIISCNDSNNTFIFSHYDNFDLSLPVTARISIFSKKETSNTLLFSILLPPATIK